MLPAIPPAQSERARSIRLRAWAGPRSTRLRSRQPRPAARYFSTCAGEIVNTEPTPSKPCQSGSSGKPEGSLISYGPQASHGSCCQYSSAGEPPKRNRLTNPALWEASASVSCAAIHSAIFAATSGAGRACPLRRHLRPVDAIHHVGPVHRRRLAESAPRVSNRSPPFCRFSPWHRLQCSAKNGFTRALYSSVTARRRIFLNRARRQRRGGGDEHSRHFFHDDVSS